ncbi:MAG: type IV pilin protein [Thiotrichales bacterium]
MKSRGFTLVELMIVLAILSVLASIAYPSYTQYVQRTNRVEAVSLLLEAASRQERYYSTQSPNTYAPNMTALGYSGNWMPTANGKYKVRVAIGDATNYVLVAVPQGAQANDGCGRFKIRRDGKKFATGALSVAECWKN